MKPRAARGVCGLGGMAVAVAAAAWLLQPRGAGVPHAAPAPSQPRYSSSLHAAPRPVPDMAAEPASVAARSSGAVPVAPEGIVGVPTFVVDGRGRLLLDAATGERIERLLELGAQPDKPFDAAAAATQDLPPALANEGRTLIGAYRNYVTARNDLFRSAGATDGRDTVQARHAQLIGMRRTLFGPEAARLLFGEDESRTQAVLDQLARDGG